MFASRSELVAEIARLPHDWHKVGSVSADMLTAVLRHVGDRTIPHSIETGSGKTSLLFSHISNDHKIFALEMYGGVATNSVTGVKESPLFNRQTAEFIEGPTQRTLPRYEFRDKLQLALIDGPHAYPFPDLEYYYIYPHLDTGALLIVDDIHIPTIHHLFDFLKEDEMFELLEVVDKSAFFRRTSCPTFDPCLDGWWLQKYNKARYPLPIDEEKGDSARDERTLTQRLKSRVPRPVKRTVKRILRRA